MSRAASRSGMGRPAFAAMQSAHRGRSRIRAATTAGSPSMARYYPRTTTATTTQRKTNDVTG
jgi:hypothetical protein